MYEWFRKRRERRKVSGEGQTYDLPKNGNSSYIYKNLALYSAVGGMSSWCDLSALIFILKKLIVFY